MSHIKNLALQGIEVAELRRLAIAHLGKSQDEVDGMGRSELVEELASKSGADLVLSSELDSREVSFKPSFYIMAISGLSKGGPPNSASDTHVQAAFDRINSKLSQQGIPTIKEFRVHGVTKLSEKVIELVLTWNQVYRFWKPDTIERSHIYEVRFGVVILDFKAGRAMVACHTRPERDSIVKAIKSSFNVNLSPMVLTQKLLDQIGRFTQVRRAHYFISESGHDMPSNITYADQKLANFKIARNEESDPRSVRKQSFYLVDLGAENNQGVGATSDSGKLWISRNTPLTTVRDFAVALLQKLGGTLRSMAADGKVQQVIDTYGISKSSVLKGVKTPLREEIVRLTTAIVHMLVQGQESRQYEVPFEIAGTGASKWFLKPKLVLVDPDTGESSYWVDETGQMPFVRIEEDHNGELACKGLYSDNAIDLTGVSHPVTDAKVEIVDLLNSLQIVPTPELLYGMRELIEPLESSFDALQGIQTLPFVIQAGTIRLNQARATGRADLSQLGSSLSPAEVSEFKKALQQPVDPDRRKGIYKKLRILGEKCQAESDSNCRSCVQDKRYLCLRSLVGHFTKETLLLKHKGIELSDLQSKISVGQREYRSFGFAKLSENQSSGLTARNKNGSVLLAQVIMQAERSVFDIVMIVSPSTINEDLRERLEVVCSVFGKHLVILDEDSLAKLYLELKDQESFEPWTVEDMEKNSRKSKKSKDSKAA